MRESVELMKYAVSTCPTLAMAATLREKVYDICQNYSTRSRGNKAGMDFENMYFIILVTVLTCIGTIKTTLRVVAEIGLISVLAAPDWRSKEVPSPQLDYMLFDFYCHILFLSPSNLHKNLRILLLRITVALRIFTSFETLAGGEERGPCRRLQF